MTLQMLLKAIFVSSFFAGSGWGAVYYVTPGGNAAWPQCANIGTPCSWQTALANAVAGDTVYFRGGTYNPGTAPISPGLAMNPAHSGVAGSPIEFRAYPGETPHIDGTNTGFSFGASGRDFIVWDGFSGQARDFIDSERENSFFVFWTSSGSVVRNCNFTGFHQDVYKNTSLIRLEGCTNCEVYNNRLHDMTGETAAVNTTAIWVFGGHSNNYEAPCPPGVQCSKGVRIHHNTIANCKNGIQQKTGPNFNHEIYANFFRDITSNGILLNEQTAYGGGVKVFQNVLVRVGGGVALGGSSDTLTINDYEVFNNTIFTHNNGAGLYSGEFTRNARLWNNIVYGSSMHDPFVRVYDGVALPAYINFNDYYSPSTPFWNINYAVNYESLAAWQTGLGGGCPRDNTECSSRTSDPGFVNPGGSNPEDYRRTSYPADGRGGAYASVMGAYILGNEVIGSTLAPAAGPSSPKGLRVQ